jgi:hypothetical protein
MDRAALAERAVEGDILGFAAADFSNVTALFRVVSRADPMLFASNPVQTEFAVVIMCNAASKAVFLLSH